MNPLGHYGEHRYVMILCISAVMYANCFTLKDTITPIMVFFFKICVLEKVIQTFVNILMSIINHQLLL